MELKVVKQNENALILEATNETVTFCNLIRGELWKDRNVSEAAYIKEHPYLEKPKIFVKTSRGKPQTALERAAKRLESKVAEFGKEFEKAKK